MLDLRTPHDLIAAMKRRKLLLAIPLVLGVCLSAAMAVFWPPVYQSMATILIEEPEVPRDLISSTVTSYADERIQVISRRVMTTPNIISVIDKFDLYTEKRKYEPISAVAEAMREDITLSLVSADVVDPRSGRPSQATIAFTLAFDHRSPTSAQKVLNELVTLFLAENLRTRRQAAAETTGFLKSEAEKYRQLVDQYEARLAEFKQQHAGNLPEQMPIKIGLKDRTERTLLEIRGRLQTLGERRIYLEAQLAQLSPYLESRDATGLAADPRERLRALRTQYISLTGKYGSGHPDVRKLEREIKALEQEVGPGGTRAALVAEKQALTTRLADLRTKYSEKHPDILQARRQLDIVESRLDTMPSGNEALGAGGSANPAYVQLQAQVEAIDTETRSLKEQQAQLAGRLEAFDKEILSAPEIEREYRLLNRDYERALSSYNSVKDKLTTAELGEALEAESKAEQFSLVEPPTYPNSPIKPNRLAIFALGMALSIVLGGGLAALRESTDASVYGPLQLAAVTGSPPLVVVPKIWTAADIKRKWAIRMGMGVGIVAILVGAMLAVHLLIMPLDVLVAVAERNAVSVTSDFRGN